MPIPEETLLRDDAVVAIDLILPKIMVPQLQSVLVTAGEMEGYRCLNDLFVEAIHQEIRRLRHRYNVDSRGPAGTTSI